MSKLDKAKEIIKALCPVIRCGIFDCRGFMPDPMETVYDEDGLRIDVCFYYEYFEVFGLTDAEFAELEAFYYEEGRKDG